MSVSQEVTLKKLTAHFLDKSYQDLDAIQDQIRLYESGKMDIGAGTSKSYYNRPCETHRYDSWKHRNDSNQVSSNLKWSSKSKIETAPTRSFTELSRVNSSTRTNSKTRLKNTVVSDGYLKRSASTHNKNRPPPSDDEHISKFHKYYQTLRPKSESEHSDDIDEIDSTYIFDKGENLLLNKFTDNDLARLKKFRDDYYFQCHSVDNNVEDFSERHACRHEFVINDRLCPEAMYTDHERTSRCLDCHLPLNVSEKRSKTSRKKVGKIHMCKLSGIDSSSSSDSDADDNLGSSTPEIFIKVPSKHFLHIPQLQYTAEDLNFRRSNVPSVASKSKPSHDEAPLDSFALRYQKRYKKYP
ncbi:uncharacterized protein LOC143917578 [Arctopsyche grandis]|uniref:uncharacterized protein LOC143917578 n=1 Tax=Arctopsyche grandis TaxID=121162 RepID=UPI00406D71AF